jgi:hypothetical protein
MTVAGYTIPLQDSVVETMKMLQLLHSNKVHKQVIARATTRFLPR